ncbi:MAG: hypothetical protein KF688_00935 [Pirellulales bacterium]|nr:hypothetical protein [Pirellulales bacterium]MBX3432988.1 hypothetical protein [Pirellulales bacterium]
MSKALTIAGLVVAGLVALVFTLDLLISIPFQGASTLMDVGAIIGAAMLGYASFEAFREVK